MATICPSRHPARPPASAKRQPNTRLQQIVVSRRPRQMHLTSLTAAFPLCPCRPLHEAFVGSSNLGMALGPLLSLPLASLPDRHLAGLPVNPVTAIGWVMAACWTAFFVATAFWFPEPPRRLPIGLARDSMLLPPDGSAAENGVDSTASSGSQPSGRGGGRGVELRQPLLETVNSCVPAEVAGGADVEQADEAHAGVASAAAELAPAGEPLLPHVQRAALEDVALHKNKPTERRAAAAWRATVPGTVACTLALFVQKMVGDVGVGVVG